MPSEAWSLNPTTHTSLESLKETFKQRLDVVLYKQLTIENIETFADEALNETVKLSEDILKEYRNNPNVSARPTTLSSREQEDEAFTILGLENINGILERINKVKDSIDSLKTYINTNVENTNTVITPPQENQSPEIAARDGSFEKKKMFPRLLTLLYIIEHDFEIPPAGVKIIEGIVIPKMMRKTPYVRVEIPDLERAVYICDEEGNASYVFDTIKLAEKELTLEEIDVDDKGDKNSLIAYHPGIGIRIVQSPNWRSRIATALRETIPAVQTGISEKHEREARERLSEFKERPQWLSFEEFRTQVLAAYPGQGSILRWYKKNYHQNWPSHPDMVYKDKGWIGWPELVMKENFLKKEFLSFAEFQSEVKSLYSGTGNIRKWYDKEYKKHKNWPSGPQRVYEGKGWIGWPEFIGKENRLKIEYLSLSDLRAQVRVLYPGKIPIVNWYHREKNNHERWPFNPEKFYKDKGWVGWPEFIGKEDRLKYLTWSDFKNEVTSLYPGEGAITNWYYKEKKNHKNWPATPDNVYKDKGWTSWPDLVGKKKL